MERLSPGKYVVAVSGGVDSVVLLHMLAQHDDASLVVAHVDHGIRGQASVEDAEFVKELATKLNLDYEQISLGLDPSASEATAREKRYDFLESVQKKYGAAAIVTAHHQDDVIETAIINLLRGTNRAGLSSLKDRESIRRPLLSITKQDIKDYAFEHKLEWREDATNQDTKYVRNYVRHEIVPKLSKEQRDSFIQIIEASSAQNTEIDEILRELEGVITTAENNFISLNRPWFIVQPEALRKEVLIDLIKRTNEKHELDAKQLSYIDLFARTAKHGTRHQISSSQHLEIQDAKVLVRTKTSSR